MSARVQSLLLGEGVEQEWPVSEGDYLADVDDGRAGSGGGRFESLSVPGWAGWRLALLWLAWATAWLGELSVVG